VPREQNEAHAEVGAGAQVQSVEARRTEH
jgi:hypothetical protein